MSLYAPFEWFYFDLHSDDGLDLVCTVHPHPFNSVFNIALCDIYIYRGQDTILHHFFVIPPPETASAGPGHDLKLNDNNIINYKNDCISVRLKDDDLELTFDLKKGVPPKELRRHQLMPSEQSGSFNWIVSAGSTGARASVTFKKQRWELSGTGYHDYNSGDVNLKKKLKYWLWAKLYTSDGLLVVGNIVDGKHNQRNIAFLQHGDDLIFDDLVEISDRGSEVVYRAFKKTFTFKRIQRELVDEAYFYMKRHDRAYYYTAGREVISGLVRGQKKLNFLKRIVNNTHYRRLRISCEDTAGNTVSGFMEEMYF